MSLIIVKNDPPPIPVRRFDWHAFIDGTEEGGMVGYGETEAEALLDLAEQLAEFYMENMK
jgi:hypothetical protein